MAKKVINKGEDVNLLTAIKYANDSLNNIIPANKWHKLACQRFLNDLQRNDLIYRREKVDEMINFFHDLELIDSITPTNFNPEPWQIFIVAALFGHYYADNKEKRRYRSAIIHMGRKNGKSFFINAIAFYFFVTEYYSNIVVAANSFNQAKLIDYKVLKAFAQQMDYTGKQIVVGHNTIKYDYNSSACNVITSSRTSNDGMNISLGIVDEMHEAKDSKLYDLIKQSQGSRVNPMLLIISSAGFNLDGPYHQLLSYYKSVLEGINEDDSCFAMIYQIDDGMSIYDKDAIKMANPNAGISTQLDFYEDELRKCKINPAELPSVEVKLFGKWQSNKNKEVYIEEPYIRKSLTKLDLEDFKGCDVNAAFDLASVDDLTSVSLMAVKDDKHYFFNYYYVPTDSLSSAKNKMLYQQWAANGQIIQTPGNVTDYDYVLNDFIKWRDNGVNFRLISYDATNSTQFSVDLTSNGFRLKPFSQTRYSFNAATKEFKRLIMCNKLVIDSSPITYWCMNNAVLSIDNLNGNIKPIKASIGSNSKIDSVQTMVMALGGYLQNPQVQMNAF